MSTTTDVLKSHKETRTIRISRSARVYKTLNDRITVVIVSYGSPSENKTLVQINVPGWDHPLNGKIIKHIATIDNSIKSVEFYNDKFATNHLSLYSKDSFWRFQLQVCLPGIGERKATCDEDASAQIDTLAFVQCYLKNKSYEF